jgi:hypothetical protein
MCALALAIARSGAAQETVNYGSIRGRVADPQNAVIQGARVTARHLDTNVAVETTSDDRGLFRFPYLRVGAYAVSVSAKGFADVTQSLTLTVGSAFDLPVSLPVDALDARVIVTSDTTVLDAARSQLAGTVSDSEIQRLPANGRNFLDVAMLLPGVSPTNVGGTQLFAETSAVPGSGVSVASQRNFSNNFIVDGLSANDDAAGLSGIPYGLDAVEQFQVVTSGGQAELGRALGGYVNVVTRSGTNALRGAFYGYFGDDTLNASNALSNSTLPMSQQQFGASIGGPIVRNRTFFFGNVERRLLDQSGLTTITDPNVTTINARLVEVGYQGAAVTTGIYPNPVHTLNLMAKADHQLNGSDFLNVRYALYHVASDNSRGAGGLNAPSASAGLDNVDQAIAAGNTLTLSSRLVNETRAQFAWSDLQAPPTDPIGPAVNISSAAAFGTLSGSPTRRENRMFQAVDNISYQWKAHALRAGADFLFNADRITYPRAVRGSYLFSSMANFLSGVYSNSGFTQTFGESQVSQGNSNVGVYAQDEWTVGPGLTLNVGVRYDLQFLETIVTDTENVSPRVGFAWVPGTSRRSVVRGNAGLFYDRVPLRAVANALLSAGNTTDLGELRQIGVSLSPGQAGAPVFPNVLDAPVPSVTLVNFTTMDRHMQNASSIQGSLEYEQQLGDRITVSAGYQYVRGRHLIIAINQNVPSCAASGTNNGCRPNPSYANNNQYSPGGDSNYHGLQLSLLQRPVRWGGYRVSYTFSKSMNNVGENFFSSPIDPHDVWKDWGRSDDDQRHRLVVSGSLSSSTDPPRNAWERLTHDFQLSGVLRTYSALPFNITSGVTTIQGTAGRPVVDGQFIERNAGVGDDFLTLGLRVSRTFRLGGRVTADGLVEAFNVTNRRNDLTRNAVWGTGAYPTDPLPTFGTVTAVGDPRSFQFAFRVSY